MERAFSWDLEQWLFFGGYPGAALFVDQDEVWARYVTDSLIEKQTDYQDQDRAQNQGAHQ